jgi:hypothetical protein
MGSLRRGLLASLALLFVNLLPMALLLPGAHGAPAAGTGKSKISAVFVFGDSIVDPGNNNNRLTEARADFPPYGEDFPGGVATGRFSNGKVPGDMLGTYQRELSFVVVANGKQLLIPLHKFSLGFSLNLN